MASTETNNDIILSSCLLITCNSLIEYCGMLVHVEVYSSEQNPDCVISAHSWM